MPEERLQKLIARSGQCSRRDAEQMIREGRVTVNGRVAGLGDRADVERDHVRSTVSRGAPSAAYLLLTPRE
jgi:23S rRNA pseudouridine2605 synthase